MSKKITTLEDDEFWKDCLKDSHKKIKIIDPKYVMDLKAGSTRNKKPHNFNFMNNSSFFNRHQNKNLDNSNNNSKERLKTYQKSSRNNSNNSVKNLNKSQIIRDALYTEEIEPMQIRKQHKKTINHMRMMYQIQMDQKKMARERDERLKNEAEKEQNMQCTFKPRRYKNKSIEKKIKDFNYMNIYQREVERRKKKKEKLKEIRDLEYDEYTKGFKKYEFTPKLNRYDLYNVFYNKDYQEKYDNDSTKIFLYRLMKAREENDYKKNRLDNYIADYLRIDWKQRNKIKRSISQREGMMLKKSLHKDLINYKSNRGSINNDTNNNNMNDDNKIYTSKNNRGNNNNYYYNNINNQEDINNIINIQDNNHVNNFNINIPQGENVIIDIEDANKLERLEDKIKGN